MGRKNLNFEGGSWRQSDTADDDGLSMFQRVMIAAAGDEDEGGDESDLTVCDEADLFDGMEWE